MTIRPCAALLLLALAPAAARAQKTPVPVPDAPPPPEYGQPAPVPVRSFGWAGGSLVLALPTGEFKNYVHAGGGLNFFGALKLVPDGTLSLRLDGTFLIYGLETRTVPLGTGPLSLVDVDVQTSNIILGLYVGPQLTVPHGAVRPYANAGIGVSGFFTGSSVSGTDNGESFASSTNFSDGTFAVRAGGGVWIQAFRGRRPVSIDIGAQYVWNGRVSYLREGSITFSDIAGNPEYHPIRSETHLWLIYVGVSASLVPKAP
jgi:hypothetical protein